MENSMRQNHYTPLRTTQFKKATSKVRGSRGGICFLVDWQTLTFAFTVESLILNKIKIQFLGDWLEWRLSRKRPTACMVCKTFMERWQGKAPSL